VRLQLDNASLTNRQRTYDRLHLPPYLESQPPTLDEICAPCIRTIPSFVHPAHKDYDRIVAELARAIKKAQEKTAKGAAKPAKGKKVAGVATSPESATEVGEQEAVVPDNGKGASTDILEVVVALKPKKNEAAIFEALYVTVRGRACTHCANLKKGCRQVSRVPFVHTADRPWSSRLILF